MYSPESDEAICNPRPQIARTGGEVVRAGSVCQSAFKYHWLDVGHVRYVSTPTQEDISAVLLQGKRRYWESGDVSDVINVHMGIDNICVERRDKAAQSSQTILHRQLRRLLE